MVYMGNIAKEHNELTDDEKLLLKFGNGDEVTILKEDKIEKQNGDLKITRENINVVYVDTAFVKFMVKSRRFI